MHIFADFIGRGEVLTLKSSNRFPVGRSSPIEHNDVSRNVTLGNEHLQETYWKLLSVSTSPRPIKSANMCMWRSSLQIKQSRPWTPLSPALASLRILLPPPFPWPQLRRHISVFCPRALYLFQSAPPVEERKRVQQIWSGSRHLCIWHTLWSKLSNLRRVS